MKFAKGGRVANAKSYAKAFSTGGFVDEFTAGMTKGYGEGSKKKRLSGILPGSEGYKPAEAATTGTVGTGAEEDK